jgi:hypothetical protein
MFIIENLAIKEYNALKLVKANYLILYNNIFLDNDGTLYRAKSTYDLRIISI